MAKFATVRDLKNQTTALIREAEKGKLWLSRAAESPWPHSKPSSKKISRERSIIQQVPMIT